MTKSRNQISHSFSGPDFRRKKAVTRRLRMVVALRSLSKMPKHSARSSELPATWETFVGDASTIMGSAFWPRLNDIIARFARLNYSKVPELLLYHKQALEREYVQKVLYPD